MYACGNSQLYVSVMQPLESGELTTLDPGRVLNTAFKGGDCPWRQIQNCIPLSYSTSTIFSVCLITVLLDTSHFAADRCQWETSLVADHPALCALLLSMLDEVCPFIISFCCTQSQDECSLERWKFFPPYEQLNFGAL